jgi:hypothetical protein
MWITNADDIEDELRELTLASNWMVSENWEMLVGEWNRDDIVDEAIDEFVASSVLDQSSARDRLVDLPYGAEPATEAERLATWEMWKAALRSV